MKYAIPQGVSPLAFHAILNHRAGTVHMLAREPRAIIVVSKLPDDGSRFDYSKNVRYELLEHDTWEDACRKVGIL